MEEKDSNQQVKPLVGGDGTVSINKTKIATKTIAKTAILTALSFLLYMFVKFPIIGIFPSFLEVQFSDLPALLGGFAMGPIAGSVIIVLKCLFKLPFSHTMYAGEISDIFVGLAFIIPSALIYKHHKSTKNALIGLTVGTICSVVVSMLANWLVIIPFYVANMFGGSWNGLLDMCGLVFKNITVDNFYLYYIFGSVLPFNILRCLLVSVLTFASYKKLSPILHK